MLLTFSFLHVLGEGLVPEQEDQVEETEYACAGQPQEQEQN